MSHKVDVRSSHAKKLNALRVLYQLILALSPAGYPTDSFNIDKSIQKYFLENI